MKTKFNVLVKLSLLMILSFSSCQKEDLTTEVPNETSSQPFNIKRIETIDFSSINNYKIKEKVNELKAYKPSKGNANIARENWEQITIDTTSVKLIETEEGYNSYTFDVLNSEEYNYVETIIISHFPNDSIETVLATYHLNDSYEAIISGNINEQITQSTYTVLDDSTEIIESSSDSARTSDCVIVGYWIEVSKCEGQVYGADECYDEFGNELKIEIFVIEGDTCDWDHVAFDGSPVYGSAGPDHYDNEYGEPDNGGNNGNNGETVELPDNFLLTIPKINYAKELIEALDLHKTNDTDIISYILENNFQNLNGEGNIVEESFAYLLINEMSDVAKENLKLRLTAEFVNDEENPQWDFSYSGTYNGISSLQYDARYIRPNNQGTMYLLKNTTDPQQNHKQVLLVTSQPHNINGQYDNTIVPTDFPTDNNYHYLYNYDTQDWYEFGLPLPEFDCLACDFNSMFEYLLTNAIVISGRYFLPVEDIVILIEGKDFDGVESSRAVAAGFLLLDVIPGTALLKLIKVSKFGDEAIDIANAIRKIADDIHLQQREIIEEFSNALLSSTSKRKGNFGEIATDVDLYEKGYTRLQTSPITDIDAYGHPGIDHVFKNENTGEFIVIESKWGNNGQNQANLDTGLPRQMSDDWITDETMSSSDRLFQAIGEDISLYQEILSSGYTRLKANVAPDGPVIYRFVASDGYQINGLGGIFTP